MPVLALQVFTSWLDADGKPSEDVTLALRARLRALAGTQVDIRVEPHKDTRSARANAYLWGVVYAEMAKYSAHTPDEIHDAMCERFLPNEQRRVEFYNRLTGERLKVTTDSRRSSKLSGEAFYDFVERVREFAREFMGVDTPDPDPAYWRKKRAA